MLDFLIRLLKALLSSLFMLFDRIPAIEMIRGWFGGGQSAFAAGRGLLLLLAALALGLVSFLLFLAFLKRLAPKSAEGKRLVRTFSPEDQP